MPAPTTEPLEVTVGDSIQWTRSLPDYPATAGWVLSYTLINAAHKITLTGTASGSDHLIDIPAATSDDWVAGAYAWHAYVTSGASRHTVGTGSITLRPNLAAASTYDNRSAARKALDAIEAALQANGSRAHLESFTIGDRQQKFRSMGDLLAARSRLRAEVAGEENAQRLRAGLAPRNQLLVRFGVGR